MSTPDSTADLARRRLLLGLAALASGCSRCEPATAAEPSSRELAFEPSPAHPDEQRALLLLPAAPEGSPVLVALHGRGEAHRGLKAGALAWRDDYGLERLEARLRAPPLSPADLGGLVTPDRLALINGSLAKAPYRGLTTACPFTPDLADRSAEGAREFGRFVVERLLPRVRAETGASRERAQTGIAGVSMGGRLALLVGLSHPETFGAVGALQPALRAEDGGFISRLAQEAFAERDVSLRLVSSEADPFLPAIRAVSDRLRRDGVIHELLIVPGGHDYEWNRGPGGAEMLLWHERVQRGLAAP